ncbi:MAG: hypothetical protein QNJ97_11780 [Myxococcota bacterium]|nr:hypothetical protein [Myxococcota bacterium]
MPFRHQQNQLKTLPTALVSFLCVNLALGPALAQGVEKETPAADSISPAADSEPSKAGSKAAAADASNTTDAGEQEKAQEKAAATCFPACRSGFTCINGVCKSPCNPACQTGEVCTMNGHCLPSATQPAAQTGPSAGTTSTGRQYTRQDSAEMIARTEYNELKYKEFQKKKGGGAVMTVVGVLSMCGAVVLGVIAGVKASEGEDATAQLAVGAGIEVFGTIILISGIVSIVKGNKGMKKAKENFYIPPEQSSVRSLRFAQSEPLKMPRETPSAPGISLDLRF